MTQDQPGQQPQIDTSVASIARIYDYWLGGRDNFKADREAAELMIQQYPDIVTAATWPPTAASPASPDGERPDPA